MGNGLFNDPSQMDDLGRKTVQNMDALNNEMNSLRNNIDDLFSVWSGDAQASFNTSYESLGDTLEKFKNLLAETGEALSSGANSFAETEQEGIDRAANINKDYDFMKGGN